ncbi:RidA family protein [Kozakia baliensis]|uniref:hypothetical protein n=1 Tax=Kozakia baliensis TaxID=153496 RepID=UPI000495C101|nr:hypothetical protein [Kozakia baliensis]
MQEFSSHVSPSTLTEDVSYDDIAGTLPDGRVPDVMAEECQLALARVADTLAEHDLTVQDISQMAYMIGDSDNFAPCQRLIVEFLGNATPILTLRLTPSFQRPGQRLALSFMVSR